MVKNFEPEPGLIYIKKGSMVAILPDAEQGGVVNLKPGDFFGELTMAFRYLNKAHKANDASS